MLLRMDLLIVIIYKKKIEQCMDEMYESTVHDWELTAVTFGPCLLGPAGSKPIC